MSDASAQTSRVFISYASADRERALEIADALEAAGISVWIDRRGIAGGTQWAGEITSAIRACDLLIALCSTSAVTSRNVRQELQLAWDLDRAILPLLLEPVDFPDAIAYFLHGTQWIQLFAREPSQWIVDVQAAVAGLTRSATPRTEDVHPATAPDRLSGNLPASLTPTIGREAEIQQVLDLLEHRGARLVTISGPGGVGKTRIALEAGARAKRIARDGTWFVDLAPLSDPALLTPAMLQGLGIHDQNVESPRDRLCAYLRERELLLVLDNFERLVPAAPDVSSLLSCSANLRVIATSRMRLNLSSEHEVVVEPLSVPDSRADLSAAEAADSPAVRLFVERARAVDPSFALTDSNAATVCAICARLDGLPLAIELAAARTKFYPLPALLGRLEHRLPMLSGGARDLPARQRTLRDTIGWSYDLLSHDEQRLFQRLGVFSGGFTLEAAEAVCGSNGVDVTSGLEALLEMSLIRRDSSVELPRFKMLETIREFSVELLTDSGEEPDLRRLHAEWCAALAREFVNQVQVWQDLDTWSTRLDPELDNIRSAIAWLLRSGDIPLLFSILTATEDYWQARPFMTEVCGWLEQAVAATAGQVSYQRSLALGATVVMLASSGRVEEALTMADTSLREAEALGDSLLLGRAHMACAVASEYAGDGARAAVKYAEARPYFEDESLAWYAFWADAELGDKFIWLSDLERGIPLVDKAIENARAAKHDWGIASACLYRAHGAVEERNFDHAIRLFDEAHRIAHTSRDVRVALAAVQGLASIALGDGRPEIAARLLGAMETARISIGVARLVCQLHRDKAERLLREALGIATFQREFEAGRATAWEAIAAEIQRPYLGVDDGGMP